jgi:hypothetical protein
VTFEQHEREIQMKRDENRARAKKVTDAMLKMVKLDVAALEQAYRS